MNHHDCARVTALAPAWAIGALDIDEAALVTRHLAGCDLRHAEMREALVLASLFGEAGVAPRSRPTPCARRRLLDAVRADAG